jgi:hypothetical protein
MATLSYSFFSNSHRRFPQVSREGHESDKMAVLLRLFLDSACDHLPKRYDEICHLAISGDPSKKGRLFYDKCRTVVKKLSRQDRFFKELRVLCALVPLRDAISSADPLLAFDVDRRALYLKYKGKLTLKQFGKRNATDEWVKVLRSITKQVCPLTDLCIYPGDLHTENVVLDSESRPHLIDVENWRVGHSSL